MPTYKKFYQEMLPPCLYLQKYVVTHITEAFILPLPYVLSEIVWPMKASNNSQGEFLMMAMGSLIFKEHQIGKKYAFKKIGMTTVARSILAFLPGEVSDCLFVYAPVGLVKIIVDNVRISKRWVKINILNECVRFSPPVGKDRFFAPAPPIDIIPKTTKELRDFTKEQIKKVGII